MCSHEDSMLIFEHAWRDLSGIWMQLITHPGGEVPSTWLLGVLFVFYLSYTLGETACGMDVFGMGGW